MLTNEELTAEADRVTSEAFGHVLNSKRLTEAHKRAALHVSADLLEAIRDSLRGVAGIGIGAVDVALIGEAAAASLLSTMTQTRELAEQEMLQATNGR